MNFRINKDRALIKSLFFGMGARMIERRTLMMPLMISFPSIGFIVSTASLIILLIVVNFYKKTI
jgi:hypothetical protein